MPPNFLTRRLSGFKRLFPPYLLPSLFLSLLSCLSLLPLRCSFPLYIHSSNHCFLSLRCSRLFLLHAVILHESRRCLVTLSYAFRWKQWRADSLHFNVFFMQSSQVKCVTYYVEDTKLSYRIIYKENIVIRVSHFTTHSDDCSKARVMLTSVTGDALLTLCYSLADTSFQVRRKYH